MFAGHIGLAAAVKSQPPRIPLWASMLSTQLLDALFLSALSRAKTQPINQQKSSRTWAIIAGSVTCPLLALSLTTDVLGIG